MSHNLESSLDGFQTAFASRKVPAWHGLGTVFEGELTTKEMLEVSHLANWDVRLEQVPLPEGYRAVKDAYFVVRNNPFDAGVDVLATVGERYRVLQNEELLAFGDAMLAGGGIWETAGSIKEGRQVFASLAMPGSVTLDPNGRADKVENYLLLNTSHDGSVAIQASNTPVRVVCQNTLNFALRGVKQTFKVRHTQTASGKVQAAREALSINVAYLDEFAEEANKLIQTEITDQQFEKIVKAVYPEPDKENKAGTTRWTAKRDQLFDIWNGEADGPNTMRDITGTAWGALNALTEQLDWYRKPRKGSAESVMSAASGFEPVLNAQKNKIRNAVLALT